MFNIAFLSRALGCSPQIVGDAVLFTEVAIDSRVVVAGGIFFAILGPHRDGHDYLKAVIKSGVTCLVVSRMPQVIPAGVTIFCVRDTTVALGQLASAHRERYCLPVIAITGSAGKTTAKNLITAVLESRYHVLRNERSENNQYGVPLTLLRLTPKHDIAVLELGTNRPGDIDQLAAMVRPTVAIFTNIGPGHLEGLQSVEGVFREKGSLLSHLQDDGTVIVNGDDPFLKRLADHNRDRTVCTFGFQDGNMMKAGQSRLIRNARLEFSVDGELYQIETIAPHNIYNALVAISCGSLFEIRYNDIQRSLAKFVFEDNRLEVRRADSLLIVDDTYNANPVSFKGAIDAFRQLKVSGKRIGVVGDMRELGDASRSQHEQLAQWLVDARFDMVCTFGTEAAVVHEWLQRHAEGLVTFHCRTLSTLHRRLSREVKDSDAVLVKGSRAMRMERTVKFLLRRFS